MFANTLFKCVSYNKEENQIFTSGTDRKIGYWESFDGTLIRDLEGSKAGAINAMDLSPDGQYFVTGGDDKLLKVRCFIVILTALFLTCVSSYVFHKPSFRLVWSRSFLL